MQQTVLRENKVNIPICRLLKNLHSMLSINILYLQTKVPIINRVIMCDQILCVL